MGKKGRKSKAKSIEKNVTLWEITNYLYAYTISAVYVNAIKVYYQVVCCCCIFIGILKLNCNAFSFLDIFAEVARGQNNVLL